MYFPGAMGGNNIPKEAGARPEIGQADVREEVEYSEKFGAKTRFGHSFTHACTIPRVKLMLFFNY